MAGTTTGHKLRVSVIRVLASLVALVVVLLATLLLVQQHLKGPLVRYVADHSQRQIKVDGPFRASILSWHPRIVAEGVTIGNPPWVPPGVTAEIGHLELTYDLVPKFRLHTVVAEGATLHLKREENGHSNWQTRPPGSGRGTGPPLIRSLRMPNARVFFDDARRNLKFDGTMTAQDLPGGWPHPPLRIEGAGQLNGHAAHLALNGDPLATVTRDHPYRFTFMEASTDTLLTGTGQVPKPFDFSYLDLTFASTGEDMKDLYFLTGISLPDTAGYHLTGEFKLQDHHVAFNNLQARAGQSDMQGTLVIVTRRGGAPSHTQAQLRSKLLRTTDLGARAAGRNEAADDDSRLLSDTPFHLQGTRRSLADIDFHAGTFEMGRVPVRDLAMHVNINLGTLRVTPLSATVRDGKVTGGFVIDATQDVPRADVDFKVAHLRLALSDGKPPPVEGALQGRISLEGRGNSLHDLAANATGTVTAVLPHGAMRSSLAELAGLNLRGLGLMASANQGDTGIRCGIASFDVKDGTLLAQRLLVDTEPVLITGEGRIDLESEALDLQLIGRPKHPRLRLRAPLLVRGTLKHPAFSIEARKPLAQAGAAIALGVLLTPVAAMLAFVDPGLAKDSDCGALLAPVQKADK